MPGRIARVPAQPPQTLFHGTSPEAAQVIRGQGLRPMGRQFVHLSADRGTAYAVGSRKAPHPIILAIDAQAAAAQGVSFYAGNDKVWLADHVPGAFIA